MFKIYIKINFLIKIKIFLILIKYLSNLPLTAYDKASYCKRFGALVFNAKALIPQINESVWNSFVLFNTFLITIYLR